MANRRTGTDSWVAPGGDDRMSSAREAKRDYRDRSPDASTGTCASCRHWREDPAAFTAIRSGSKRVRTYGKCRRRASFVIISGERAGEEVWPSTSSTQGCGDHRERSDAD